MTARIHYPQARLLVFCKAPIPGQVKTRLFPILSAEAAAQLHITLATQTIDRCIESQLCPVELWCSPDANHAFFQETKAIFGVTLQTQQGNDLGERMSYAFDTVLEETPFAILVGCDSPSLTVKLLNEACQALDRGNEAVIAPAEDGGYTLLGLRSCHSALFKDIAWGTETVFSKTLHRLEGLGLMVHLLPMQWDVDRPRDYVRYRKM